MLSVILRLGYCSMAALRDLVVKESAPAQTSKAGWLFQVPIPDYAFVLLLPAAC